MSEYSQIPSGALPTIFGADFDPKTYAEKVETLNKIVSIVSIEHREKSGNIAVVISDE